MVNLRHILADFHPAMAPMGHLEDLFLKLRIKKVFEDPRVALELDQLDIDFSLVEDGEHFKVDFSAGLSRTTAQYFIGKLEQEQEFLLTLLRFIGPAHAYAKARFRLNVEEGVIQSISLSFDPQ